MLKCNKCNVKYNGNLKYCPLCQNKLMGTATNSVFPIIKKKKDSILNKIFMFVSLIVGIIFSFIEYVITHKLEISKFVILGLITNYILIKFILNNYKNVLKMINKYFIVILFILFMWYLVTKYILITTYLIPILCLIIFAFNTIIMIILKDDYVIKYTKTILLDCLIGLIPLILVNFGLSECKILSYVCVIFDLIIFIGLIIFYRDYIIEELKKIFNC